MKREAVVREMRVAVVSEEGAGRVRQEAGRVVRSGSFKCVDIVVHRHVTAAWHGCRLIPDKEQ